MPSLQSKFLLDQQGGWGRHVRSKDILADHSLRSFYWRFRVCWWWLRPSRIIGELLFHNCLSAAWVSSVSQCWHLSNPRCSLLKEPATSATAVSLKSFCWAAMSAGHGGYTLTASILHWLPGRAYIAETYGGRISAIASLSSENSTSSWFLVSVGCWDSWSSSDHLFQPSDSGETEKGELSVNGTNSA